MPPSKTNPKQKKVKDIGRIATSETLPVVTTNHTQNGLDAILIYPSLVWLSLSLWTHPLRKKMPSFMDSLSLKSLPASHAKLMAQMETPTNTATAMLVCLDKMVTTWMQWASVGYGCFQWIGCLGKSLSQKAWNLSQIFP